MLSSTQELQVCHSSPHSFPGFLIGALSMIIEFENSKGESAASQPAPARGGSAEPLGCSTRAQDSFEMHQPGTRALISTGQLLPDPHVIPCSRRCFTQLRTTGKLLVQGVRSNRIWYFCHVLLVARTALKAGDIGKPVLRNLVTQEDHSCFLLSKKLFHCGFVGLESKYLRQKPQYSIYLVK